LALTGDPSQPMSDLFIRQLLAALIFAVVGIVVLAVAWWIMVKVSPFSFRKEIEEDQNVALAIVAGAVIIGISLIIAAAVHG
jgi:uncharacterized membrane protein YjfL (UPF0719 family)